MSTIRTPFQVLFFLTFGFLVGSSLNAIAQDLIKPDINAMVNNRVPKEAEFVPLKTKLPREPNSPPAGGRNGLR